MGEFYASRGRFGFAFRFNYMDLETNKASGEGLIQTDVDVAITAGINDLLASWQVHEKVSLFTGIRHVHNKVVVDVESRINDIVLVDETVKVSDDDAFDLLLGASFNHWFTPHWGIMINGDIGVIGDNDRDYNAEFRALYHFGKLNNVWFGYRYLRIGNDTPKMASSTAWT